MIRHLDNTKSPLGRLTSWIHGHGGHLTLATANGQAQICFMHRGKVVGSVTGKDLTEAAENGRHQLGEVQKRIQLAVKKE